MMWLLWISLGIAIGVAAGWFIWSEDEPLSPQEEQDRFHRETQRRDLR